MADPIDAALRTRLLALAAAVPLEAPLPPDATTVRVPPGSPRLSPPARRASSLLAGVALAAVAILLGVYLAAGGGVPALTPSATPSVACGFANPADCQAALGPTLAAVPTIGHPVTTVTFATGQLCQVPSLVFSGAFCPSYLPPGTTRAVGNAVVAFAATTDEAFLNVFVGAQGIVVDFITVATPPTSPSASPVVSPVKVTARWTPVTLPSVPGQVVSPIGGPYTGGLDAVPGGGFVDFIPTAEEGTVVLQSADGTRWTQVGSVSGPDAGGIGGPLAYDGHVYVALGGETGGGYYGEQTNGAAWVSTDLRHWTKAPDQAAFSGVKSWNGIAARPSGFVAIGYADGGHTVWTSPDGLAWTQLNDEVAFPTEAAEPRAIAATTDGYLAVGRVGDEAAAWTSPDGLHWTVHGPFPGGNGVVLNGLAHGAAGWVTIGFGPQADVPPSEYEAPAAGWTSTDGVTWQAGPPSAAISGLYGDVVAVPGGFVAAGTIGLGVGVFLSTDGLVWTAAPGLDVSTATAITIRSDGQHVVVATSGPAGSAVWVSSGVTP
ncbi:MAG TPA: hypothetical protein VMH24_04370 [Candidatus Sulfotelmatobacter sp.]|nr:hypothetical protein [Candidatus Sulfotelmatobacter sp.]